MAGLNKVMLIGRLGRDPEIKYSQGGAAICTFSLATSEQWTDKNSGEKQERTEWSKIVVFGKAAETCEKYLTKGSQIFCEGRLQTRQYEKEGQTHYTTEVVVSNFQFLGGGQNQNHGQGKNQDGDQPQKRQHGQPQQPQQPGHDQSYYSHDDIPF